MEQMYKESWGWDDAAKKRELKAENARYIIIHEKESRRPMGFVHFQFSMEESMDRPDRETLYCWEIQLEEDVRGKGLGKFLMQLLELIGRKQEMQCIMLTCPKSNPRAIQFYKSKLGFTLDPISPTEMDAHHVTYEILSKSFPPKK
eukprot:TRINITY_DN2294_c0_g1_i1.p1 TRINITY_DN2294_c0_g1~~TRINITY_DN2294_c0_g1_i1.p1  ORF type:complete len:146 (-),score=50.62 TRINITY_DN2294_c0_g1_i1:17-454(-)